MKTSPTARSLAECKRLGLVASVVEKWVPQARRRVDLLGWADIVALWPRAAFKHRLDEPEFVLHPCVVFIQTTSGNGGNHAARVAKIREWPHLADLLATGARVEVWSWAKRGKRGARKLWTLRREPVSAGGDEYTGPTNAYLRDKIQL